jgi:putative ABC transport system permease protein
MQTHFDETIEQLYGIAFGQQVAVMAVAALGVVTALLISVLQRRRELGLLRAVGASRAQVLRSVLAEALLMGAVGTVIGLAVGVPLQWYALRVVLLEETGYAFPVYVPWAAALWIALASVAAATLAGLGPALHATRQPIAEAVAQE